MGFVAVNKRISTYKESKCDHAPLKINIVNDIDPEKRKAGKNKREHHAVYSSGYRCCYSQSIPVDLKIHVRCKDKAYLQ